MNEEEKKKVILISFQFVQKTLRSCLFESNKIILRVKKKKRKKGKIMAVSRSTIIIHILMATPNSGPVPKLSSEAKS